MLIDLNRGMQTVWVMGNETDVLDKVPRPEVEGYLTDGGECVWQYESLSNSGALF